MDDLSFSDCMLEECGVCCAQCGEEKCHCDGMRCSGQSMKNCLSWREGTMNPEVFKQRMTELEEQPFREMRHIMGDRLMCDILRALGYYEGVRVFEKMDKWYA